LQPATRPSPPPLGGRTGLGGRGRRPRPDGVYQGPVLGRLVQRLVLVLKRPRAPLARFADIVEGDEQPATGCGVPLIGASETDLIARRIGADPIKWIAGSYIGRRRFP